jgi:hypothetical protein
MKIEINITLSDDTTESRLANLGLSRATLGKIYEDAFTNLLEGLDGGSSVKKEINVVVTNNT